MKKYNVYENGELILSYASVAEIAEKTKYAVNYLYNVINTYGGKVKNIEIEYKAGSFDKDEFSYLWDYETNNVRNKLLNKRKTKESKDIITSSARAYR